MPRLGWLLLALALLLAGLQYRFWFGAGSSGEVSALENQVAHQLRENQGLQERNDALAAEVEDLKSGEEAVEERARSELGMIKPGEKFYRVVEGAGAGTGLEPLRGADADGAGGFPAASDALQDDTP